ncbi:MAG: hypothetical protein BMS9Abin02_0034 [Anaerolineae bacterium]|nr:MAG: hypothetical protein BMS9Abin02_0034 [Anaerolineae bacterium]
MLKLEVTTTTPRAKVLMEHGQKFRILNVFESSCNLVDSDAAVLSLVTSSIAPGPFSAVVEPARKKNDGLFDFRDHIQAGSRVRATSEMLAIDDLRIVNIKDRCWEPRVNWENTKAGQIRHFLPLLTNQILELAPEESLATPILKETYQAFHHQKAAAAWEQLSNGIKCTDLTKFDEGVADLAGLGPGLTPAGDDFLMGFIYSFWANSDINSRKSMIKRIIQLAGNRTNTLSRAWLEAAGRGEAAAPWHDLVKGIVRDDLTLVEETTNDILDIGSSSGADALAGFVATSILLAQLP